MIYGLPVRLVLGALLATALGCSPDPPEKPKEKSALEDYIVTPLEKAEGAKELAQEHYEERKKAWDSAGR